jgi:uncharacterized protein YkwD
MLRLCCSLLALSACSLIAPTHTREEEPSEGHSPAWNDGSYDPFDDAAYRSLQRATIDPEHLNTDALSAALFVETNAARRREGMPALKFEPHCRVAAQRYCDDMVRLNFYDAQHGHPDAALATPKLRMDAAGLKGATAWGENIAVSFGIRYKSGDSFYEPAAPGQPFLDLNNQPIPPHTYQSFAVAVVDQWMRSPHHRANILDRDFTHFGAACAAFREKDGFPKLKCSQDFMRLGFPPAN